MVSCFLDGPQGRLHYLDYSTQEVTADLSKVFNFEEAVPDQPALIFLPGLTNHAHYWDEIAPFFLENYAVYALDWRGHGDSAAATSYGFADYAADLARLVNYLAPTRYFLVGHSFGGYVALFYASQLKETAGLAGIVACDVKTSSTEEEHLAGRKAGAKPQPFFHNRAEVAARLRATMPDSSVSEERLLELAQEGVFEEGQAVRLKYDRQVLDFEPVDPYSFAAQVTVPTLVINGANSEIMNTKQARELVKTLPQAKRVEIPEAGHFVYLDRPADFAEAVKSFLGKQASSKSRNKS